ncbi:hypothetical protein OA07_01665 [Aphanizomenon flos-aquae 2012/KM1/D3]|nr:hypothetical protein OA07_01665 [Aphanizomenon flos-aquae 2012/KM1/D3]
MKVVRSETKKTITGVLAPKEIDEYPLINIKKNIPINKINFLNFPTEGVDIISISNPINDKPK